MTGTIKAQRASTRYLLNFAVVMGSLVLLLLRDSATLPIESSRAPLVSAKEIPDHYFGATVVGAKTVPQIKLGSVRTWNAHNVAWTDLNPAPNAYNWSNLDSIMDRAQNQGYDVLYTFGRTPRWASSDPEAPSQGYGPGQCAPPSDFQYWDDFVRAIAVRASGRIKYWETWNEPQEFPPRGSYCGDIATMVKLQQHAYGIIRSIDPSAMVLTPSASGGVGPRWMAKFLDAGGGQYADIMAFHGYGERNVESVLSLINGYQRVFAASGQGSKPIWDTEAGWGENRWFSDPDLQAAFLAKFYLLHWSAGVERFYWYAYDEPRWGTLWDPINGLRKAGVAYREVRKWMLGATMERPCAATASVWICNFSRPNGYHAIAAWTSTGESSFLVEGQYKQYRDLVGRVTKIGGHNVRISNSPVLVETEPFIPD